MSKLTCEVDCNGTVGFIMADPKNCNLAKNIVLNSKTIIYIGNEQGKLVRAIYADANIIDIRKANDFLMISKAIDIEDPAAIQDALLNSVVNTAQTKISDLECSEYSREVLVVPAGSYDLDQAETYCKTSEATAKCTLSKASGLCRINFICNKSGKVAGYDSEITKREPLPATCNAIITGPNSNATCPPIDVCITEATTPLNKYLNRLDTRQFETDESKPKYKIEKTGSQEK
ncbi:MAG: hypothetical protein QE271_04610 [Bacteriovoracaceae bacterium]|nr:hypothetical protein [Bacteriovoracaceae bacterium]